MTPDLVMVTCHERPELLYHCLAHLVKTPEVDSGEVKIIICPDNRSPKGQNAGVIEVASTFQRYADVGLCVPPQHRYRGNSYNTLHAYRYGASHTREFVFLVEEDVMVGKDFFRWHKMVMAQGDWFCSVGVLNQRRSDLPIGGVEDFYISNSDYASLGVCFRPEWLEHVLVHDKKIYYESMNSYVRTTFPGSRFGKSFAEQDGLILRVMERVGGVSAWPCIPRAYHAGWYGYNRPASRGLGGTTLGENIATLGMLLETSPEIIRSMSQDYDDIRPCPLFGYAFEKVHLVGGLP